ncbi:ABC-three component system protein [Rhizobium leguminosarum]|uniref:ABC-three component system protein n=1 Tax=Rhizobium leguminosarum TaxID=384 RepID=UPI001C905464|nr:ABC-three component system protein [Rhizobium leguminosarum]MBY2952046.1 hypothetical protein [Rhizobium leguminosarum]
MVSLEVLDDVAVHQADGKTIVEQCKSATKQNPLSDWAEDLWKTLCNWLDFLEAGELDTTTIQYRLYVTPARFGEIAKLLHEARTGDQVDVAVESIEASLTGMKKKPACKHLVARFLEADPEHRRMLVSRLRVISEDNDPVEPLREIFKPTVSPLIVDLICERAIGAAKEAADRMIRAGLPAKIDADRFRAELRAFIQKNNLPGFLSSLTDHPSSEAVTEVLQSRPTFVRQLELIDIPPEGRVRAVSDYLRTAADISKWGESGLIFEANLRDWDEDLIGRYQFIAGEISDTHAEHDGETQGRIIYRRCATLQPPFEGRAVPGHFVHGSFNALSENRRLGWHPDFSVLLEADE